ncbi:unnamed protein product [Calypogeia fissa]
MEKAEAHYRYRAFHTQPRESLHEVLQMHFLDWKFSNLARQRKLQVATIGLKHRNAKLAELGVHEDYDKAMAEGRFAGAEYDDSEDDGKYSGAIAPFDVYLEVGKFARDNQILHPEPLLEWASAIPYTINGGCLGTVNGRMQSKQPSLDRVAGKPSISIVHR